MSLCIAAGGSIIALAANAFTLSWTHSVEKTQWRENWLVLEDRLQVTEGFVQGSGAGIYLPDTARPVEGGWAYEVQLQPIESLSLAASGATVSPWTLCTQDQCLDLGAKAQEDVRLWAGDRCDPAISAQPADAR